MHIEIKIKVINRYQIHKFVCRFHVLVPIYITMVQYTALQVYACILAKLCYIHACKSLHSASITMNFLSDGFLYTDIFQLVSAYDTNSKCIFNIFSTCCSALENFVTSPTRVLNDTALLVTKAVERKSMYYLF